MFIRDQLMLFETLAALSAERGVSLCVVGGVLRDIFAGDNPAEKDVDFLVAGNAIEFAEAASGRLQAELATFPDFITAKLLKPQRMPSLEEIDFASARVEVYKAPGQLPRVQLAGQSGGREWRQLVEADLRRRDFSINAMALELSRLLAWIAGGSGRLDALYQDVLDPFEGRHDLDKRLVRVLHERSFIDDPTRIFRAARYAVRIGGKLEGRTEDLLRRAVSGKALETVSANRKLTELKRIFGERRPEKILKLLSRHDVFGHFPIYPREYEEQLFIVLRRLSDLDTISSNDFRYHLALRLFLFYMQKSGRAAEFQSFGLGRKQMHRMENDLTSSFAPEHINQLSDEALVLALLWDENRDVLSELADAARRRGLIVRPG